MARRRRQNPSLIRESLALTRGTAHLLDVLKARHPDRDEARLALKCVGELEAALTDTLQQMGGNAGEAR